MNKTEEIKALLASLLETLANATVDMEVEETDCGTLYCPILKYILTFEFSKQDIRLIKAIAKEELEDFSTLTEI